MDYMFDFQHYKQSLRLCCPGLRLYDDIQDPRNYAFLHSLKALQPEDLQEHTDKGRPDPGTWYQDFQMWLQCETSGTLFNTANLHPTTFVALNRSYLIYPI